MCQQFRLQEAENFKNTFNQRHLNREYCKSYKFIVGEFFADYKLSEL